MLSACLIPWDIFEQEEGEVNEEMGEFTEFAAYFANDPLKTICYLMLGNFWECEQQWSRDSRTL